MNAARLLSAALLLVTLTGSAADAQLLKLRSTIFKEKKINLIEAVKLQGDLRLRHESINKKTGGSLARQRQRLRLRLDSEISLPSYLTVGLRLASGIGEQVSANQSFDDLASQKNIYLSRVYLRWKPFVSLDGSFHITGGKMPNPMWRVASSDIVWDPDLNVEGLGEGIEWLLPDLGGIYFLNALQAPVDEDSGSEADQWLFSGQAGAEYKLPLSSRLRIAGSYHHWINERMTTFGQTATNEGNRRTLTAPNAGALANEFGVWEVTGQLSTWISALPLRLQGSYINNAAASRSYDPRENTGYQVGAILGEAKEHRSWEAAYFFKFVRTDATVADIADSDFGDGGTNRKGHIFWLACNPRDWMQLKAKYFYTMAVSDALAPGEDDINRLQLDMTVKF